VTDIGVKLIHPAAVMPTAAHPGDAMDLYAIEEVILLPNMPVLVRTGLVLDIPPGWRAWITPRSGLALKHGITVANAPGLIDAGYRGEVGVILVKFEGYTQLTVMPGDRIAQISFQPIVPVSLTQVAEVSETSRGAGGFGSTGK
jgi:dUTP pyrophosphatase